MSTPDANDRRVEPVPTNAPAATQPPAPVLSDVDDEEQPSISGTGCLIVIAASIIVSALLYIFVISRNPDTRGPAYIAASSLFGFFIVGITWGVIQQQRESDRARDAEEAFTDPDD
ncbi:MAG TPA: hypothetical protein VEW66_07340 [Thermomicrobiales bacterium]|nr:hypothetical protein [Thermomicrobiales bacterium]